jgi:hypothetical protein
MFTDNLPGMLSRLILISTVLFGATFVAVPVAHALPSDAELALRWAPVHYQDTDSSDYDADYLSTVDFDGDWNARNNWEAQDDSVSRLIGSVYYSVAETSTHWFLVYSYYHARDWTEFDPFGLLTHENDMEGVLLVVRRDGSAFGVLEAMVTNAHGNFYSYTAPGSPYTAGRESIDGTVIMQSHDGVSRPTTRQEAKGHGCYAWNGGAFPGNDGVVYFPGTGEVPANGNDRSVGYRLVDTFAAGGLWAHRNDTATFASWGTLRGDNGKDNAAQTAWGWDDGDDGSDLQRGLLATDPARLVSVYFADEGTFSLSYTRNPYL